jgi:hypothetical protein
VVLDLLLRHAVEHLGGLRILAAQAFGEAAIDAAVLVFAGDGESKDFLLGEIGKTFHGEPRLTLAWSI